jgi:hypothetical protein
MRTQSQDAKDVRVQLPAAREWEQRTDRTLGMRRAREEEHVGSGARRLARPTLDGCVVNDRERVGDRESVEAQRAQPTVG